MELLPTVISFFWLRNEGVWEPGTQLFSLAALMRVMNAKISVRIRVISKTEKENPVFDLHRRLKSSLISRLVKVIERIDIIACAYFMVYRMWS